MNLNYFAYGSNLWIDQMAARVGFISDPQRPPQIARLVSYRLVFQYSQCSEEAVANILTPGEGVIGVIYPCTEAQLVRLDIFERGYARHLMPLEVSEGELVQAFAYVMTGGPTLRHGRPSEVYLKKIITGARQHKLPERYISGIALAAEAIRC